MALLLQGVVGGGGSLHHNSIRLDLQRLRGIRGQHHSAGDDKGGAHVLLGDLLKVRHHICVHDHLKVLEAGTVVKLNEAKGLHIPDGPGPSADGDRLAPKGLLIGKQAGDFGLFHVLHMILPLSI